MSTYTCAKCQGTFEKGWSDAEAEAELEQNFGPVPQEEREIICDDCYKELVDLAARKGRLLRDL